jgi:lipopolysaccharide transport system ATP-binding protein
MLVDEVLAVGDVIFQKKCLGKMKDVSSEGRTVLFVSHNMVAVQNLCDRIIWIDQGRIARDGGVDEVIGEYMKKSFASSSEQVWEDIKEAPGNAKVRLHRIRIMAVDGSTSDIIYMHNDIEIDIEFWNQESGAFLDTTIHLYNEQGIAVLGSGTSKEPNWHGKPLKKGLYINRCKIPGHLLNSGRYNLTLLIAKNQNTVLFKYENIMSFDVLDSKESRDGWFGKRIGVIRPFLQWESDFLKTLPQ